MHCCSNCIVLLFSDGGTLFLHLMYHSCSLVVSLLCCCLVVFLCLCCCHSIVILLLPYCPCFMCCCFLIVSLLLYCSVFVVNRGHFVDVALLLVASGCTMIFAVSLTTRMFLLLS